MGRHTFEQVLSFDPWPYGDLTIIVMSSQTIIIPEHLRNHVTTSSESPSNLIRRLSLQGEKHLYIDGGITIQRFLAEKLINQITITIVPILLGAGKSLFRKIKNDIELNLIESRTFGDFVQMKYQVV